MSLCRENNQVYQAYNNTYPVTAALALSKGVIGSEIALEAAWMHLRVHGRLLDGPRAELVYVAGKGGFRLVYKTLVAVEAPFGYWEHDIEAVSGEVVSVRDTAVSGKKSGISLPDFAAYRGVVWSRKEATWVWEAAKPQRPH